MEKYNYINDVLNALKQAKNSLKIKKVILLPFDVVYLNKLGWKITSTTPTEITLERIAD